MGGKKSSLEGRGGRLGGGPRALFDVSGKDCSPGVKIGRLGVVDALGRPSSNRLPFPRGAGGGGVLGGGDGGGAS